MRFTLYRYTVNIELFSGIVILSGKEEFENQKTIVLGLYYAKERCSERKNKKSNAFLLE